MHQQLPWVTDQILRARLRLEGYRGRSVDASTGRVHVLDAPGRGDLPAVLVLHGLSSTSAQYDNLLRRLRPHVRRVLAADLPGHGQSAAPAPGLCHRTMYQGLEEALDQVLGQPTVLFGNSLGGAAAIRYALHRPERVAGLVLAAPAGAPTPPAMMEALRARLAMADHEAALDFVDRLFHRPHPLRHVLALGVRGSFAQPSVGQLLRSLGPDAMLRPEDLAALAMPTLVLWGGADRVFGPEERDFFARHLPPHARFVHVTRYGHVPHMCHPDCLAGRILAQCRAIAAGTAAYGGGDRPAALP
ncbi:MAG: alpha/beta fold hydrolase [Sandaracinaceae bacterium]